MKRILLLLSFCFLLLPMLHAQKVGLVLSGGGAKGMTHIGIIRALEENNIPIDYITGTSMGAIIGSLYAMGYSPDDMEALLRSEDFKRWYSGKVEPKYAKFNVSNSIKQQNTYLEMSKEIKEKYSSIKTIEIDNSKDIEEVKKILKEFINF